MVKKCEGGRGFLFSGMLLFDDVVSRKNLHHSIRPFRHHSHSHRHDGIHHRCIVSKAVILFVPSTANWELKKTTVS